jgi:hypothetical protein
MTILSEWLTQTALSSCACEGPLVGRSTGCLTASTANHDALPLDDPFCLANRQSTRLFVEDDLAGRQNREMGHVLTRFGTVPVTFARGDQDDVTKGDMEFLRFGGDNTVAARDDQDLIDRVVMQPIASAVLKCDGRDAQQFGVIIGDEILPENIADKHMRRVLLCAVEIELDPFHLHPSQNVTVGPPLATPAYDISQRWRRQPDRTPHDHGTLSA